MARIYTDDELRSMIAQLAEEAGSTPPGRPAILRARRRLARNLVGLTLALAMLGYGSIALADRFNRRVEPVLPAPDRMTTGLWTMDEHGKNAVQITDGSEDGQPAWSPDGTRIAFTRLVDDNVELFVVNADGSRPTRLTRSAEKEGSPAWRADGDGIAFVRGEPDSPVIFSIAPDGSDERRLIAGGSPSFSLGGKWLTYECPSRGEGKLCQTDPDAGTEPVEVDTGGRVATNPVWVNDSTLVFNEGGHEPKLVAKHYLMKSFEPRPTWPGHWMGGLEAGPGPFEGVVYALGGDLFVTPVGGPKFERITFDPTVHDSHPAWNPVAKRIVVRRVVDPPSAIFVAEADGSNVRQLTEGRRVDGGAVASPDGKTIAFASSRDGYAAVYLMNADGTKQRPITFETSGNVRPLWSPDGGLLYVMRPHPMNPVETGIGVIASSGGSVPDEIVSPRFGLGVPSLSLDGQTLAFGSGPPQDGGIMTVGIDGQGFRTITGGGSWPAMGPGNMMAFVRRGNDRDDIWVVDLDDPALAPRLVGSVAGRDKTGLFWGTGPEILYTTMGDIFAIHPTTGATRRIALAGNQYNPSWTPDGRILFNGEVPSGGP